MKGRRGQANKENSILLFLLLLFLWMQSPELWFSLALSGSKISLSLSKNRNANPLGLIFCIILGTSFRPLFYIEALILSFARSFHLQALSLSSNEDLLFYVYFLIPWLFLCSWRSKWNSLMIRLFRDFCYTERKRE